MVILDSLPFISMVSKGHVTSFHREDGWRYMHIIPTCKRDGHNPKGCIPNLITLSEGTNG